MTFLARKQLYSMFLVSLQLNRLDFRLLPGFFQKLLVLFDVNISKAFATSKNKYVAIKFRERYYPSIHRFFIFDTNIKLYYYNEINWKRKKDKEISNFYYITRIQGDKDNNIHNRMCLYFFNKLLVTNKPYFYWIYSNAYYSDKVDVRLGTKSHHIRTYIFFLYFHLLTTFLDTPKKKLISFKRFTLKTFRGIHIAFAFLSANKKFKFLTRKITKPAKAKEDPKLALEKFKVRANNLFFVKANLAIKGRLDNIARTVLRIKKTGLIVELRSIFPIRWFTKLHNSIINPTKSTIILYLRAARHFNKGRYSRNRQLYRTGVYWCIWLNVVIVYALHYYFYRVVFAFGYLWLPFAVMILSMFGSRLYKYRYYSPWQVKTEFNEYSNFLFYNYLKVQLWFREKFFTKSNTIAKFFANYSMIVYSLISNKATTASSFFKKVFL